MSSESVLILGTADWNSDIRTNQHNVAEGLALSCDTFFVESMALRRPRFSRRDLARIAKRLLNRKGSASQGWMPSSLTVLSPRTLPFHNRVTRPINRRLLSRLTRRWANGNGPKVLYTFTPLTYGLEHIADRVVYHCVDLLEEVPGIRPSLIAYGEGLLAEHPKVIGIASSRAVRDHLERRGFVHVKLLPNVADVALFSSLASSERAPTVVFAGNLVAQKVDFDLLDRVLRALPPGASMILAGPITSGLGSDVAAVERLTAAGAVYLGRLDQRQLATVVGGATVGLIPYVLNSYTRGVSPLKCFEYLAGGLAVVSTELPELLEVADGQDIIVARGERLVEEVCGQLSPRSADVQGRRIRLAEAHGWPGRIQALSMLALDGL